MLGTFLFALPDFALPHVRTLTLPSPQALLPLASLCGRSSQLLLRLREVVRAVTWFPLSCAHVRGVMWLPLSSLVFCLPMWLPYCLPMWLPLSNRVYSLLMRLTPGSDVYCGGSTISPNDNEGIQKSYDEVCSCFPSDPLTITETHTHTHTHTHSPRARSLALSLALGLSLSHFPPSCSLAERP